LSKRVTIKIEDDLDKKLRLLQANSIKSNSHWVSYSSVITEILQNSFKK